jgi:hypothetical protein
MRVKDEEALQVAYSVYTKDIVDRHMIVPAQVVAESVELQRSLGTPIKRKAERPLRQFLCEQSRQERFSERALGQVRRASQPC